VITLPVTRRADEIGRAGPVPVARWVTDRNPPRSEVRAPPLFFPEGRRRRVRPMQTLWHSTRLAVRQPQAQALQTVRRTTSATVETGRSSAGMHVGRKLAPEPVGQVDLRLRRAEQVPLHPMQVLYVLRQIFGAGVQEEVIDRGAKSFDQNGVRDEIEIDHGTPPRQ
jgi:hypothetical protein